MLRVAGALGALAGLSVMAWWSMTSGANAPALATDMEVPFAGLGALLAGTFAWMVGMARREAEQEVEWARVDRLVAGAREEMIAAGYIAEPAPVATLAPEPAPSEPQVTRSHSRVVDRVRAQAPARRERRTRNGFRVEAPVERPRPRPRPRTAAARAAAARS